MNIHEYQAKALLRDYGAPVSDGRAVTRAEAVSYTHLTLPTNTVTCGYGWWGGG